MSILHRPIIQLNHVYELAPELPTDKKVPTYLLKCNGEVDLYLARTGDLSREGIPWIETQQNGGTILEPPIKMPVP